MDTKLCTIFHNAQLYDTRITFPTGISAASSQIHMHLAT